MAAVGPVGVILERFLSSNPRLDDQSLRQLVSKLGDFTDVTVAEMQFRRWIKKPAFRKHLSGETGKYEVDIVLDLLAAMGLTFTDSEWDMIKSKLPPANSVDQHGHGDVAMDAVVCVASESRDVVSTELTQVQTRRDARLQTAISNMRSRAAHLEFPEAATAELAHQLIALDSLKHAAALQTKTISYWMLKHEALEKRFLAMQEEKIANQLKPGRYCSISQAIRLAIKRNIGHASAEQMLAVLDTTANAQTVYNWEQKVANLLMVESQRYYIEAEQAIRSSTEQSFFVHTWRSDGTNSGVCQESKVQNLELVSAFFIGDASSLAETPLDDVLHEHLCAGDLQFIHDGTGLGCFGTVYKQLRGIGCKPFGNIGSSISAWCSCGDAGPDIAYCRKIIKAQIQQTDRTFCFDANCFMHQISLECLESLKQVDRVLASIGIKLPGTYFGSVARLLHTWRDTGMTGKIFRKWSEISDVSAVSYAKRKAPQPIMGRWQQQHICETFLLVPPPSELCTVLSGVINDSKTRRRLPAKTACNKSPEALQVPDDLPDLVPIEGEDKSDPPLAADLGKKTQKRKRVKSKTSASSSKGAPKAASSKPIAMLHLLFQVSSELLLKIGMRSFARLKRVCWLKRLRNTKSVGADGARTCSLSWRCPHFLWSCEWCKGRENH